jgi:hypothetical protein
MLNRQPITVFLIDDEFPVIDEFRDKGIYNSAINKDDLYHIAVNCEWNHLIDLQQLIKDIVTSQACKEGLIDLYGFNSPTQALSSINKGLVPSIVIYDWEYVNAPIYTSNSREWLLEILSNTDAFVFVYSKVRDQLPPILNDVQLSAFSERFQLFLKGGRRKLSFSAEEFIYQYIIGAATKSGKIKIYGIEIEFTANHYLQTATDILFLQRVLGNQYVLDQLSKIDFSIDTASVEKILNDSGGYLVFDEKENVIYAPENRLLNDLNPKNFIQMTYLEVIKKYSIEVLETVLERGILFV